MAGTVAGGKKAAIKNLSNDPQFYVKIGAIGGRLSKTGGFAYDNECNCDLIEGTHYLKNCAGHKGGVKSRRTKRG